jgi:hypothetical protein
MRLGEEDMLVTEAACLGRIVNQTPSTSRARLCGDPMVCVWLEQRRALEVARVG